MIFTVSLCFIFSSIWGVCFHPPLYFIYCSLEQRNMYFFLSRGTNCAGFQGIFGEKQAMAACRSTEEEIQLHPSLEVFVLINLRCISDLLNWEIQKGEEKGPCFIHAVVSSNEQLRNKPSVVQHCWLEITVNAGRICYEWCVHWMGVIMGKNRVIERKKM